MTSLLALTLAVTLSPAAPEQQPLALQAAALTRTGAAEPVGTAASTIRSAVPGGDSLKNGAIIGGVLGGLAMGGFVNFLCNALDDTGGDQPCWGGTLVWAGIGAAGGAALGAGVDALFAHQPYAAPGARGKLRPAQVSPAPAMRLRIRF